MVRLFARAAVRISSAPLVARAAAVAAPGVVAAAVAIAAVTLPASPSHAADPFRSVTLDNGLTVLLAPSDAHPVIALSGYVTTGGRTEDE
ncbi:MAG: hypothetical protein HKN12_11635, partial [Gemmatimonadetes bacterium]|nr:hypothetical protein [Gemmatimonadota bacterium]